MLDSRALRLSLGSCLLVGSFALIAILALSDPASADIVYLKSGKTIEGSVRKNIRDGTYTITTTRGTVVKPIDSVLRIEKAPLPKVQFRARYEKLDKKNLRAVAELAAWCRDKRLIPEKRKLCQIILKIDPNHEMARRELGFVVFENEWILEKELRKKRQELGLIKYAGEWMSPEEKARRQRDEQRKEIEGLFKSVRSENKIVLEYAVRRLMAYEGDHAHELFRPYLADANEHVRLVAVSSLSRYPVRSRRAVGALSAKSRAAKMKAAEDVAGELFAIYLTEPSDKVVEVLKVCLRRFHPEKTFDDVLAALRKNEHKDTVARAGEIGSALLLKDRVPDLIRAIVTEAGAGGTSPRQEHPAVLALLKKTLGVDYGYDVEEWLGWWRKNEWRFRDVP